MSDGRARLRPTVIGIRVRPLVVVGVVAMMVATTCASGDDTPTTTTTRPPATYLDRVTEIEAIRASAFENVGVTLRTTYTNTGDFFEAVLATDTGEFDGAVDEARTLRPPPEHVDDHADWVASLETTQEVFGDMARLVADGDFVGLLIEANEIFIDFGIFLVDASPAFCRAVAEGGGENAFPGGAPCIDPETIPGGEYGIRARRAALRAPAEVFPRIGAPYEIGSDDETIAYLDAIQPDVEATFAAILETLRALEPPASLEGDHEAAITYFESISRVAADITEATRAGDDAALQRLFNESARPGRELRQTLSDDGTVLFGFLANP